MPSTPSKGGHENDKPQAGRDSEMVVRDILRRPSWDGVYELAGLSKMKLRIRTQGDEQPHTIDGNRLSRHPLPRGKVSGRCLGQDARKLPALVG